MWLRSVSVMKGEAHLDIDDGGRDDETIFYYFFVCLFVCCFLQSPPRRKRNCLVVGASGATIGEFIQELSLLSFSPLFTKALILLSGVKE